MTSSRNMDVIVGMNKTCGKYTAVNIVGHTGDTGVHKPHLVLECFRFGDPRGSVRVAKPPSGKEET
jgi:hypothetical protein